MTMTPPNHESSLPPAATAGDNASTDDAMDKPEKYDTVERPCAGDLFYEKSGDM